MGALERDNNISYDEKTGNIIDIGNTNSSPMAITNRESISSLLGGKESFKSLIKKAKSLNMKIIIDSLSRISSSRANRKYRNILLRYLDNNCKLQLCYGSDGKSIQYEDSTMLNYRKIEAWELLINEMKTIINQFDIDGFHLDNCQVWPHIMELDTSELFRIDNDGVPAYTPNEILNGEIVLPKSEHGYWKSDNCPQYANPLLVKITREIWKEHPEFIFIGECWQEEKYSQHHVSLVKSGIIPRMYTLPVIICQMLGTKISRNGNIEKVKPENVSIIKEWYSTNYANLPKGAVMVQSSSGQVWPYPGLLYGRGNWSAVDLLFTLPEIPMTFMDEIDGEVYRVQITNVYTSKDSANEGGQNPSKKDMSRSKSLMKLIELKEQEKRERQKGKGKESNMVRTNSKLYLNEYLPQTDLTESISSIITMTGILTRSSQNIRNQEENLIRSIKKEDEFDLKKINIRYNQRREMRANHKSLTSGKLIYLNAYNNDNQIHPGIFTFARQTENETGVFAINFRDEETNFLLDLSSLIGENSDSNEICQIVDWTTNSNEGELYFLREITQSHVNRKIRPYSTVCFGFSLVNSNQENFKKCMERSNFRLISDLRNMDNCSLDNYKVSIQLKEILDKKLPIEEFSKWMDYIMELFDKYSININDYIKRLEFLKKNEKLTNQFFKYCFILKNIKTNDEKSLKVVKNAENIFNSNILGPICFVTPELGRWSTVGGLGVMVDELSQGLKSIGQDIIMISPYYNQNRKGATGYLANDPFNIHYIQNVSIQLDTKYEFGVHYGTGNDGIKYYFLHNASIFPKPYPDFGPADIVREMACFGKACLQLLCDIKIIPSLIITNDWFTGFTPAYGKSAFGDVFKGTTFLHICHNLEPSYEGRLYPSPQMGTLEHIYQFDPKWVIDPYWRVKILNPSRCAIMLSDQWATVSNSYKYDLQHGSPLSPLLNQKPHPFSYPNGIFKEKRLKSLLEKAGGDRIACKRYIQQKYFGYKDADFSVPVYSFVGRLTQQKGVLMILDSVEELIHRTNGKINILVGGMGNQSDPYVARCISKINYLRSKYSYAFWANPYEFFTDGPKINLGSDFGLMPSQFEPGGIVQHEFFIAGTPVIAFKTGGLRDTVFEFRYDLETGNGFTFESYNYHELVGAVVRSLELFKNKEKYEICRKNAKNSAIDVADVSRAWCREFCRLKNKIFFNFKEVMNEKNCNLKIEEGKNVTKLNLISDKQAKEKDDGLIPITFSYKFEKGKMPNSVLLCGQFSNWKEKLPLTFDPLSGKWNITLRLPKGRHLYKYIVNNNEWIINPMEPNVKGNDGIINNVVELK